MRNDNSSTNATHQPEPFCEFTGGYDDVDHERAAAKIRAEARAMDATPCQWNTKDCGKSRGEVITDVVNSDGRRLFTISYRADQPTAGGAALNLATAAPDMLEALQTIVSECADGTHDAGTRGMALASAAIARATR